MKALILKTFLLSSVIATAMTPAFGEAQHTLRVPFSFKIGRTLYPAGSYTVERGSRGSFVTLMDSGNRDLYQWVIAPGDPAPTDSRIVLRFDELGGNHYLRSVQCGSLITDRLDAKALAPRRELTGLNQ